jgi:hypothetical protein
MSIMDDINSTPDPMKYCRQDPFTLDRPFILTHGKTLYKGMPYLFSEGSHHVAVRLLKVWEEDDFIYLSLEELQSGRPFKVSWNLEYDGDYYLWSLADLPSIMNVSK